MKRKQKIILGSSIVIAIALGGVGLGVSRANALDPGWSSGQDISQTTDRDNENAGDVMDSSRGNSSVNNNDNRDNNRGNQTTTNQGVVGNQNMGNQFAHDNGYQAPVIGGGDAGDLPDNSKSVVGGNPTDRNGNNSNNSPSNSNSSSTPNNNDHSSTLNSNSNRGDNNNANNDQNKDKNTSSNKPVNNDNNGKEHKNKNVEPVLSKSKLVKIANKRYKEQRKVLKMRNQMRVAINNQKGAPQLRQSYLLALKKVRNHELTKKDAATYVSQQKDILQKALSQRLATLQSEYDQNEKLVRDQVNALPDGHQYDKRAIALDDAMHNLDYQLGDKSNRAYDQYNRSVNQLMAQTQNVQDAEKKQFLNEAKTNYENNLAGSDAEDPVALKHDNQKREKQLKKAYQNVLEGINNGSIKYRRSVKNAIQAQ